MQYISLMMLLTDVHNCLPSVLYSCLNQCTYCKTKHARGDLCSYSPDEIVSRAKQVFQGEILYVVITTQK